MTLFDQQPEDVSPDLDNVDTQDNDIYDNYVKEKYGEDPAALVKAVYHKDQFIEQMKREQAGLRQELNERIKMEEFLDRVNTFTSDKQSNDQNQPGQENNNTGKPAITAEEVSKLWDQRQLQATQEKNLREVTDTLKQKLGPNYASKAKDIVSQLGMDENYANDLAARSPQAFIRLLGLDRQNTESFDAPPRSAFRPSTPSVSQRNYDYYEKIRKEDPNRYWTPAIQNEIFQRALNDEKFVPTN